MKKSLLLALIIIVLFATLTSTPVSASTVNESSYVLASDSDFTLVTENPRCKYYKYVGNDEYVKVPHEINGVTVTSCYKMFAGTGVKGVITDSLYIGNMVDMFLHCTSKTLELDMDTRNVRTMQGMFSNSAVKSLDLSGLDVSSVCDMSYVFCNAKVTDLNINGWDMHKLLYTDGMFYGAKGLTTIDLSGLDTSKLDNAYQMLGYTYSFDAPDKVTIYAHTEEDAKFFRNYNKKLTDAWGSGHGPFVVEVK